MAEISDFFGKIICGDCINVMKGIPDNSVDMIWTDPPYGHGNNNGDLHSVLASGGFSEYRHAYKVEAIKNDDQDSMRRVVDGMLTEAARILKKDSCCCCCSSAGGGPSPTFAWLASRMDTGGLSFFHSVIWDKVNPGLGWKYRRQHEMVMVAHRQGGKILWNEEQPPVPNIIRMSKPRGGFHPNEKPLALMEKFISSHTTPGQVVLDPFCGSGGTLLAAEKFGCKWIGIELEPKYCEVAQKRMDEERNQPKLF